MANPSNQNSQESALKNNPQLAPEALQGTDDTQSEFSVNEIRAERREEGDTDEQSVADSSNETDAAATQSEFSVNDRLRRNS
jgi:hypothetical protein